jgi:hypothetical protein
LHAGDRCRHGHPNRYGEPGRRDGAKEPARKLKTALAWPSI